MKKNFLVLFEYYWSHGNFFCCVTWQAVEKIRAMGETDVKIVGLSADDNAMEAFMSAGADVFVPKPLRFDVLKALIQEVITKKNNTVV